MQEQLHPLTEYGKQRGLTQQQTAAVFEINYGTFRQLVSGHTGASFSRAEGWEHSSEGAVKAIEVMRWQKLNRKAA